METRKIGIDDLAPRIQQLRAKQGLLLTRKRDLKISLSDRRVEIADLEQVLKCVEDLRELLEETELTERKAFIKSFVKEVKVTGDEVLLTHTMPILPEKIFKDGAGVLYSVHYRGLKKAPRPQKP